MGEELGVTIRRADEIFSPRPFMGKVWDGICAAQLILADCTEKNPNVFYEICIARTVGKKVVLITRSAKDIPSDIKHFDYTVGTCLRGAPFRGEIFHLVIAFPGSFSDVFAASPAF
jgi:hypothetical protein